MQTPVVLLSVFNDGQPLWKTQSATVVQKQGALTDQELRKIQSFIKEHYLEMYEMWKTDSDNGFYEK